MRCPERSADEAGRLRALAEYGLDEVHGLPSLDPIVAMAAKLFECDASAVNMIGDDHVFLTASVGIGACDMSRDVSFCAHAINQDDVMIVEDAKLDPRFHDNPIVADGLVRFYAGVALRAPSGHALGAFCILDSEPRPRLTDREQVQLKDLARLVEDKLELRRLEAASMHPNRFEASAATSPNAIICFDATAHISTCNSAAAAMFGWPVDELVGRSVDMLIAKDDLPLTRAALARVLGGGAPITKGTLLMGVRRSGEQFPAELHWSRWREGDELHFSAVVQDMTDKQREHDALYHLANFDGLTGLANRNFLHRHIDERLAGSKRFALVHLALDGLNDVNTTLGHAAGDQALLTVARRLREALPASAFLARTGGGDFAVLLAEGDREEATEISDRIGVTVAEPIVIDGHEVRTSANCGIALAPDHGGNAEELTGSAALALFQARAQGPGVCWLFAPNLRAEAVARRMFDTELHRAAEREEFCLFYQPQVHLADGSVMGVEALIRWQHPVRGLLAPSAFLPALEAGTLAGPTGLWVLDTACAQAAQWRAFLPDFRISINLSAALFRSEDLAEVVAKTLERHRLPAAALDLEITENIILDQQDKVRAQLEAINRTGVTLSFDDFGTGFASLNLLRSFPVSQIKIDKSFTSAMQTSPKERIIVTGLIAMARELGIGVVAEGIEEQADADFLRAQGADKGQGYLFGRPVPAALFEELYIRNSAKRDRA